MPRLMLKEEQWSKLRTVMREYGIYDKQHLRLSMEGMLSGMRAGCPWRDLPAEFGRWNSVYKKFNDWSSKDKLMAIFKSLVITPDLEWGFVDGSIVKAHQHSAGVASHEQQSIGKSCGGNTTKIHMGVDSFGLPLGFEITAGEVHASKAAPSLIEHLPTTQYTIADRGYDSEPIRTLVREQGSTPMIPRKRNSVIGNDDMD